MVEKLGSRRGAGGAGSVPHKGRKGAGRCVLPREWGGAQVKGVSWKVRLTPLWCSKEHVWITIHAQPLVHDLCLCSGAQALGSSDSEEDEEFDLW